MSRFRSGVLVGEEVREVFDDAKGKGYALPAVNVVGTSSVNAVLEAAQQVSSPVIIQFSNGGGAFYAGKGLDNTDQQAAVMGCVSAAHHIRLLSERYEVPVILHTDHAARKLLPWVEGLMMENEKYHKQTGKALYSSHMIDLSDEPIEHNISTCVQYFERLSAIGVTLEIELGVTGGEEDGVDNTGIDSKKLYTQPEEVAYAYESMCKIGRNFTIAAAFGNVHGVYKPGNVSLKPIILKNSQDYVHQKLGTADPKPIHFVFHGGSGSSREDIREAISYGAIKMNLDTDLQWAFWQGVHGHYSAKKDYLQSQIGNPEGKDKPNKKHYDPRVWLREGEKSVVKRLKQAFEDLQCVGRN